LVRVLDLHAIRRIRLLTEHARDDAAALLRSSGADVTVTPLGTAAVDPSDIDPDSIVVIDTYRKGCALIDSVQRAGGARCVVICELGRPRELRALLEVGAHAVVLREHVAQTLLPALAAVASGQVCVPSQEVIAARRPVLSMREKQVVGLVAMGLMNVEIADRLFLAESTVKSHLSSAFAKLGVRSRHEAVEVLLNPASGLGLGVLSLDEAAMPPVAEVADLQ
jgi:DNA-binding NarL/FixJ family response regulator